MGNSESVQEELGESLENYQEGLPAEEVELLQLASVLRGFQPPARKPEVVMAQLAEVTRAAEEQQAARQMPSPAPRARTISSRWSLFLPLAIAGSAMALFFICLILLGLGIGSGRLAIGYFNRLNPGQALVSELHGLVEYQDKNGNWILVEQKAQLEPGSHLRTGLLSSVLLTLQDGSQVRLGPQTEMVLDQMDHSLSGVRVIRITQWQGQTQHQVQPSKHLNSLYLVRTPAGTSVAQGTEFTVQIDAEQQTHVIVTEGAVDVTGMETTVSVPAGKVTTVAIAHTPTVPAFLIRGEGILTVGKEGATIAGQPVVLEATSHVVGEPKTGDLVAFEGRKLSDGAFQVDRMEYLATPEANRFRLTGSVEAIADTALVVAGTVIQVDAKTLRSDAVTPGGGAVIEGAIQADQSWLATQVYDDSAGRPFQFTGIIQRMETNRWTISGLEIAIDKNTLIAAEFALGDVVKAQGWIRKNGVWLARAIQPASWAKAYFDITGIVQSTNPWVVNGITLETRAWTLIDAGIEVGDQARVRGPILADGTWVAAVIDKIIRPPDEQITLEFVGTVNSTRPWVVSGIPLVVDASTLIEGQVEIGALVSVRATRRPNGAWHAETITPIVPGSNGCATYATVVVAREGNFIFLQDGSRINLGQVQRIEGEIKVASIVLVVKCLAPDGTVTYPLLKVLTIPTGTPTPTPTLTSTATSTPPPQSIVLPNCYKITFLGVTDNKDGTFSWRYRVEELACAQDLSNWVLELPDCAQIVRALPSPWEAVHPDPNHRLNGIKWQTGAGFEQGEFTVVLSGNLSIGTTRVGAKGPDVAIGSIAGPACAIGTMTPTSTPSLTPTPTSSLTPTPTASLTLTPTITPLPTATVRIPTSTPQPTATVEIPTSIPLPPPSSGPIVITENDQNLTINCSGASVTVNGNNNTLTLLGACSSLTVRGNNNHITLQSGTPIMNTGNGNIITQR